MNTHIKNNIRVEFRKNLPLLLMSINKNKILKQFRKQQQQQQKVYSYQFLRFFVPEKFSSKFYILNSLQSAD